MCSNGPGSGNVDARPGYVPVDGVAPLLDSARVVVTPYIRATQSRVAHLAYTFGRPVVATTVGDLPEAVQDGVTGFLVEPGNSEQLACAMCKLLADPQLAARLGAAGSGASPRRGQRRPRRSPRHWLVRGRGCRDRELAE